MSAEYNHDVSLLHAIHNILLLQWDPLPIGHIATMRDEYEAYLPKLFKLTLEQATENEIFEYLWTLEHQLLEHKIQSDKTRTLAAAHQLKALQQGE